MQYQPADMVPKAIGMPRRDLCMAYVTQQYPTKYGKLRYQEARQAHREGRTGRVTTVCGEPSS